MRNKKSNTNSTDRVAKNVDFMTGFRQNIFDTIRERGMTLIELADRSGISYDSLRTVLYSNSRDVYLSKAIMLAQALDLSVDELVGADTVPDETKEVMAMCHDLTEKDLYLIRWFIRYLYQKKVHISAGKQYANVMIPDIDNDGNIKISMNQEMVDISRIDASKRNKVVFGIHLGCDNYMPHYAPNSILLVCNDRQPTIRENCVIRIGCFIYIAKRALKNGIPSYYSIRDGKHRVDEPDIDELMGYIVDVM